MPSGNHGNSDDGVRIRPWGAGVPPAPAVGTAASQRMRLGYNTNGLAFHRWTDALELLDVKLYDVTRVVAKKAVGRLREVPIWLELDDKQEIHLKTGDTLVQNGVRHAWRNHGTKPCSLVVTIVGANKT